MEENGVMAELVSGPLLPHTDTQRTNRPATSTCLNLL
jgi:hypothetical protein